MSQNGLTNLRKLVEPPHESKIASRNRSAVVVRLPATHKNEHRSEQQNVARHVDRPADRKESFEHYRDAVCSLCERVVAMASNVSLSEMRSRSRCKADVAMARQIAMYLAHTKFSILMTEVGLHFCRDRTTVSYACAQIEDRRDEFSFDLMICQLEALLGEAVEAISHSRAIVPQDCSSSEIASPDSVSLLPRLSLLEKGDDR